MDVPVWSSNNPTVGVFAMTSLRVRLPCSSLPPNVLILLCLWLLFGSPRGVSRLVSSCLSERPTCVAPFRLLPLYPGSDERAWTRITLRNSGEPSGFAKVSAPMMAAAMRRANGKDLALLKKVLES